jgi:hypothetical protein
MKLRPEKAINKTYFILSTLYENKFPGFTISQVAKLLCRHNYVVLHENIDK